MALASSGRISIGKSSVISLTPTSVIADGSSVVIAVLNDVSSCNKGDVIIISGASGTQQSKLNGYWMINEVSTGENKIWFNVYTNDVANTPSNNIVSSGTYTINLGTWENIKKTCVNIEIGLSPTTQLNLNNSIVRQLAQKITPNSLIKFSDLYSKYLAAAYVYSGTGNQLAQRYFFSTDAIAPMGSTTFNPFVYLSGTGNYITSIFGGGYWSSENLYNNLTRKYNYSTDVRTAGGNMSSTRAYAAAVSNATNAIFGGGKNTNNLNNINVYEYSSDTFIATRSAGFTISIIDGAAVGNSEFGFFTKFELTSSTMSHVKYTYSTGNIVTTTNVTHPASGDNRAASSGPTYGLFVGGGKSGNNPTFGTYIFDRITKFTYAASISTASATLSTACTDIGGSGNSTHGYFFNGKDTSSNPVLATRKFLYSNETLTTTSTLVSIPYVMDATSSSPGGF